MTDFNVKLGERIARARMEAGLTQQQLAARVGSSQNAISRYEAGDRAVSLEMLVSIAAELNKPLSYFFEGYRDVMIVRDSKIAEVIREIQEHPGDIEWLYDAWQFLKMRRSRARN